MRITAPVNRCNNSNWRADKLEVLVWEKIEGILDNPNHILTVIEKQCNNADNIGVLESELQLVEKQLRALDREQKQLLQWALKGFPAKQIVAENKRINDSKSSLESQKIGLVTQIKSSREVADQSYAGGSHSFLGSAPIGRYPRTRLSKASIAVSETSRGHSNSNP